MADINIEEKIRKQNYIYQKALAFACERLESAIGTCPYDYYGWNCGIDDDTCAGNDGGLADCWLEYIIEKVGGEA